MLHNINQTPAWQPDAEDDPALGAEPWIHETATVRRSRIGSWTEIGPYAEIIESTIDDYSYVAGVHTSITFADVGRFCSIASSVRINPVQHPMDRVTQHHCTYRRTRYGLDIRDDEELFAWRREQRITIGHDVWIGHGAILMPGVNVGVGAVIGAGAVVTKDVEPYAIVVGVPARPLRKRFDRETIDALLQSRWWEWEHDKLKANFKLLLDPQQFLQHTRSVSGRV
jgi:phosphonate metabolism protein (transferase hexapeptide repeat family)